jgi:hypothetical protein
LSQQLGYETTREKTQQRLAEILNRNDNCVFVAVDDTLVIGWIHGFYSLRVEYLKRMLYWLVNVNTLDLLYLFVRCIESHSTVILKICLIFKDK